MASELDCDPELEKIVRDMYKKARMSGVISGGKFVINTLREAMQVSGLDYVPKMWIDTAEKELEKQS